MSALKQAVAAAKNAAAPVPAAAPVIAQAATAVQTIDVVTAALIPGGAAAAPAPSTTVDALTVTISALAAAPGLSNAEALASSELTNALSSTTSTLAGVPIPGFGAAAPAIDALVAAIPTDIAGVPIPGLSAAAPAVTALTDVVISNIPAALTGPRVPSSKPAAPAPAPADQPRTVDLQTGTTISTTTSVKIPVAAATAEDESLDTPPKEVSQVRSSRPELPQPADVLRPTGDPRVTEPVMTRLGVDAFLADPSDAESSADGGASTIPTEDGFRMAGPGDGELQTLAVRRVKDVNVQQKRTGVSMYNIERLWCECTIENDCGVNVQHKTTAVSMYNINRLVLMYNEKQLGCWSVARIPLEALPGKFRGE